MNTNQIIDIEKRLDSLNNLDLDEIISNIFVNQEIDNILIGQLKIPEYIFTVRRLIKQFKQEFKTNGYYLPFQYQYQNEFGGGNLQNDIQSLYNQINAKTHNNLNSSVGFLNRLIYYQIINGFWDKSTRKVHKTNEIKVNELNDQLKYLETQLKKNFEQFKNILKDINGEKQNLQQFINQKSKELQQISNNLQTSNSNTNQIASLLNSSTSTSEKINGILKQQIQSLENINKKEDEINEYFNNQKEKIKEFEQTTKQKIIDIENQIGTFKEYLNFVESKKKFFEERNEYLNELIGREVGASLFETFKQRKKELENPVNKWLWIVIGMAILTFGAIIVIFTNMFGYLGDVPENITTIRLVTNSIKTLPFFFLLFYAIAQYNKERNFQEDYAFKSSVALTIKAYADIIQKDELKDELIVKSVANVYKSPTIYKTKKTKDDNSILDTAKDLLTTALEVLKKK